MPYRSKAEREAESKMTWTQVLEHVQGMEHCTESEARRQIANAIGDRALVARWEDERRPPFGPTQLPNPSDYPPEEKSYWQNVEIDSDNPDWVREPPPSDKFRKPLFPREIVHRIWPYSTLSKVVPLDTPQSETRQSRCEKLLKEWRAERRDELRKTLEARAKERIPGLKVREFDAAYKAVYARTLGRPRISAPPDQSTE